MDTPTPRTLAGRRAFFEDGLGKRYHAVGPGGEPLEVLALHDELAAAASFEPSLRDRVNALAGFQHASFARVRSVQRLGHAPSALTVVSDRVTGARLSDVLAVAERELLPLEINAALCLIRQLVQAVATLHEHTQGIAHGALAPERIVISTHARIVIVDHVFGAALEKLSLSHEQYWKELAIPLPNYNGTPRLDPRADVLQLGAVALALIVGRPLYSEEYPDKIGAIAERAWGLTASGGVEPLPAAVRTWLARALQLDARQSFASAVDAWTEFDRVLGGNDHAASLGTLKSFLAEYARHGGANRPAPDSMPAITVAAAVDAAPASEPSAASRAVPPPASLVPATAPRPSLKAVPNVEPVPTAKTVGATGTPTAPQAKSASAVALPSPAPAVTSVPQTVPAAKIRTRENTPAEDETGIHQRRSIPWWRRRGIAAAVVLAMLAGGGALAGRWYVMEPAAAEASGTLIVDTNPSGVAVAVDHQPRGFTPLTVTLTPGAHLLEILTGDEPRTIPVTIGAGSTASQFIELPHAVTATGQLQVRTEPSGARVSVDGTGRGTAPLTVEGLTPGTHTVVLANDFGTVTHDVTVAAGTTASLVVPMSAPQGVPVSGWISVNAPVDVQVYENERLVGSSQSDRIMVSVGRHELDIVNDALGYRATRTVTVAPGQVSPVRLEWPKGSMSINAQPWADVWIDGERIGETPIGNVAVPIGHHAVSFRHPELGEQVVRATVTLTAPTRLSIDMRKE